MPPHLGVVDGDAVMDGVLERVLDGLGVTDAVCDGVAAGDAGSSRLEYGASATDEKNVLVGGVAMTDTVDVDGTMRNSLENCTE
jgi:hypothetical protein